MTYISGTFNSSILVTIDFTFSLFLLFSVFCVRQLIILRIDFLNELSLSDMVETWLAFPLKVLNGNLLELFLFRLHLFDYDKIFDQINKILSSISFWSDKQRSSSYHLIANKNPYRCYLKRNCLCLDVLPEQVEYWSIIFDLEIWTIKNHGVFGHERPNQKFSL